MMRALVVLVVLVSVSIATSMEWQETPHTMQNLFTHGVFEAIDGHTDVFFKELAKAAPVQRPEVELILSEFNKIAKNPDMSAGCLVCQALFTAITYLVKVGYTMPDIEPAVNYTCQVIFLVMNGWPINNRPQPGLKLCEPLIKNFGPHVERIVLYNRLLPEDSCYFIDECNINEPSFELPPVGEIIGGIIFEDQAKKGWELPSRNVLPATNYRTKRRIYQTRDWQTDPNVLRVAQFTDIHVDEHYAEGAFTDCGLPLCCRDLGADWKPGTGSAGPYGEYTCNVPPTTTKMFLSKTSALNPDIVLYTGDSPPHHLWEESLDGQMNVTLWVAEQLGVYFPDALGIYSTIGNHECFPTNMYYPKHADTQTLHDTFIDAYQNLSAFTLDQKVTLRKAGYYTVLIELGLRVVSLNTNFGYSTNWYNLLHLHGKEYYQMMAWADETLSAARDAGEKVLLISHHPVGGNVRGYDQQMAALMMKYHDIIILNIAGHKHDDEFRMLFDEDGTEKGVQFISQSAGSYNHVNPGVRMYYIRKDDYTLLGYEQYFLNITEANTIGPAEVKMLYNTEDEYVLYDLSPASMKAFIDRMWDDDALFKKFYTNIDTATGLNTECPGACKVNVLCRQSSSNREQREECEASPPGGSNKNHGVTPSGSNMKLPSLTFCFLVIALKWLIA